MGLVVVDDVLGVDVKLDRVDLVILVEVNESNGVVIPWLACEVSTVRLQCTYLCSRFITYQTW